MKLNSTRGFLLPGYCDRMAAAPSATHYRTFETISRPISLAFRSLAAQPSLSAFCLRTSAFSFRASLVSRSCSVGSSDAHGAGGCSGTASLGCLEGAICRTFLTAFVVFNLTFFSVFWRVVLGLAVGPALLVCLSLRSAAAASGTDSKVPPSSISASAGASWSELSLAEDSSQLKLPSAGEGGLSSIPSSSCSAPSMECSNVSKRRIPPPVSPLSEDWRLPYVYIKCTDMA